MFWLKIHIKKIYLGSSVTKIISIIVRNHSSHREVKCIDSVCFFVSSFFFCLFVCFCNVEVENTHLLLSFTFLCSRNCLHHRQKSFITQRSKMYWLCLHFVSSFLFLFVFCLCFVCVCVCGCVCGDVGVWGGCVCVGGCVFVLFLFLSLSCFGFCLICFLFWFCLSFIPFQYLLYAT